MLGNKYEWLPAHCLPRRQTKWGSRSRSKTQAKSKSEPSGGPRNQQIVDSRYKGQIACGSGTWPRQMHNNVNVNAVATEDCEQHYQGVCVMYDSKFEGFSLASERLESKFKKL